jgi:CheY-like chemotaxis protein
VAARRILLVEDDPDVRDLYEHVLLGAGYLVNAAESAFKAFSLIDENAYDLVVTDGTLPDGNGIAIADAAKSRGMKAVIVTGYALRFAKEDLERHDYLLKPVRPGELLLFVARSFERKPPHLFTVLFIEDDADVRQLVIQMLAENGFAVLSTAEPYAALRILAERHVDLVFADIVMPGMDRFELAEQARRLRPGIKLLFTTGFPARAAECEAMGYGRLLFKPVRQAELLLESTRHLTPDMPETTPEMPN